MAIFRSCIAFNNYFYLLRYILVAEITIFYCNIAECVVNTDCDGTSDMPACTDNACAGKLYLKDVAVKCCNY